MTETSDDDIKNLVIYGTSGLFKFIKDNNIIVFLLAAIISSNINELITNIHTNIIYPISDRFVNHKKLEKRKINIFGIDIEIGKTVNAFFKITFTFLMIYIIYLLYAKFLSNKK